MKTDPIKLSLLKIALALFSMIGGLYFFGIGHACANTSNAQAGMLSDEYAMFQYDNSYINIGYGVPGTLNVGDLLCFGNYEQDGDLYNGPEGIVWRVLKVDKNKALVISEFVLDAKRYHDAAQDVTWETSSIRYWLNNDFYYSAFSPAERSCICRTKVENPDNRQTGSKGGKSTVDFIFLLDYDEAKNYFSSDKARQGRPTAYALRVGAYYSYDYYASWWWLRSPGQDNKWAGNVGASGGLYRNGTQVNYSGSNGYGGIRPAFWLVYR